MIQKINDSVSVVLVYDSRDKKVRPTRLIWKGRVHLVKKVGLHHSYRRGRNLYHVFSVSSETLFFRLLLDTDTLFWRLEEISDGMPG